MAFSIKKHLQDYNKQKEKQAKECKTCVADISSGDMVGHAQLMKVKEALQHAIVDLPEGYDVFVLSCCADTAQDQVIFAVTREMGYRDKAMFAIFDDTRKIEHLVHQAPHIRFSLSKNCETMLAAIEVPATGKMEKSISFAAEYSKVVEELCEQYMGIVFQIKDVKKTSCTE